MEATVRKRRTTHPMSYYWSLVKDMDDSQKKELAIMIIESIKPAPAEPPMKRYTMDDINAMIDEAERQIAAGETISHEDMMREWEEDQQAEGTGGRVRTRAVWLQAQEEVRPGCGQGSTEADAQPRHRSD
ncbi:MAG: hypothetical protein IJP74_04760 [Prevotella sp.]|nr:hypothetical protein [Prevotella sp.]